MEKLLVEFRTEPAGFTLLEILCALSIFSLLTLSAQLSTKGIISNRALQTTVAQIKAELINTQRIALLQHSTCSLRFLKNSIQKDCGRKHYHFLKGISVRANFGSLQNSSNIFLARTQLSTSVGSIVVAHRNKTCKLYISIRGAIRESC